MNEKVKGNLTRHEERLFNLFSHDRGFQFWKSLKKMEAVESHYKYSLNICRKENNPGAYNGLLPVVYKWMEDAYIDYGLQLGQKKLRWEVLSPEVFHDPDNLWRRRDFGTQIVMLGVLGAEWTGCFRFYEYFIQIEKSSPSEFCVSHGSMPPSLSYYLYHYLVYSNPGCRTKFFPSSTND